MTGTQLPSPHGAFLWIRSATISFGRMTERLIVPVARRNFHPTAGDSPSSRSQLLSTRCDSRDIRVLPCPPLPAGHRRLMLRLPLAIYVWASTTMRLSMPCGSIASIRPLLYSRPGHDRLPRLLNQALQDSQSCQINCLSSPQLLHHSGLVIADRAGRQFQPLGAFLDTEPLGQQDQNLALSQSQ